MKISAISPSIDTSHCVSTEKRLADESQNDLSTSLSPIPSISVSVMYIY